MSQEKKGSPEKGEENRHRQGQGSGGWENQKCVQLEEQRKKGRKEI